MTHFPLGLGGSLRIPGVQLAAHTVDASHTANHSNTLGLGTAVDGNDFFILWAASTNGSVTGASLGGNGMTLIASVGNLNVWMISAAGFGSSAAFNVSYSAANGAAFGIWRVTHANSSPVINQTGTGASFSVGVLTNYLILCMAGALSASAISIGISGVSQDFTEGAASPIDVWHAAGHALESSSGTLGVTVNFGGGSGTGACLLGFKGHI